MQLDVRTLLIAVALSSAFCAVARFLLCRMHPAMPGLLRWAWAGVLGALALVMIAPSTTLAQAWFLSLAQLMIAGGFVLAWDGFRRFLGRAPLSLPVLGLVALGAVAPVALTQVEHAIAMRAMVNAVLVAVLSGMIARELLLGASSHRLAMRVTGWIYALNALFFLVRAVTVSQVTEAAQPLHNSGYASLTLLWWLCVNLGVTLGMALMAGERLQEELDDQASRDPLTGALNRRAFSVIAEKEVGRARRGGHPLSVLMMDLDHFKQINDQLGHAGGDEVLCRFVGLAGQVLRGEDVVCRFGGEEFMALLPETSSEHALAAAERLRAAVAASTQGPMSVTVSIGVGEMQTGESLESVIHRADVALYRAKRNGRNRCELADAASLEPSAPEACHVATHSCRSGAP